VQGSCTVYAFICAKFNFQIFLAQLFMKKLSFVVTLFFLLTTSCQEQTEEVLASVETASSNYAVSVDEAQ